MAEFTFSCELPFAAQSVYDWHLRPGAFQRLVPGWEPVRMAGDDAFKPLHEGAVRSIALPLGMRWHAGHQDFVDGRQFVDVQLRGPMRAWRHTHRFEPLGEQRCRLVDAIRFEGPLGLPLGGLLRPRMQRMFAFRHRRTRDDLERHRPAPVGLKVGITGASGFIGSNLRAYLSTGGQTVLPMSRGSGREGCIRWRPELDKSAAEGLDAVVHLAGESLVGIWTKSKRDKIMRSREDYTYQLCTELAALEQPPKVLVATSAVGFYGDRPGSELTVDSASGTGFLAEVCRRWEAATAPAREAGIRVVTVRVGVVLSPAGGALRAMLPAWWLGLGAQLGDGSHYLPWVDLDDLVAIFGQAVWDPDFPELVNGVAPEPVPQATFARILAKTLKRPLFLTAPRRPLELLMGSLKEMIFSDQKVLPSALEDHGFKFHHRRLNSCLAWQLGRFSGGPGEG